MPNPASRTRHRRARSRVTMADIARAAHVDRSTVSLALRHQPRIPVATRERIHATALRLGYRPDPLLAAFNVHREHRRNPSVRLGMAFVSDLSSREALQASLPHREMLVGATDAAGRLGYSVTLFLVGPDQLSPARLDQVLQARGISALIVAAVAPDTTRLPLSWGRYSAIALESFHLREPLDHLSLDHRAAARRDVTHLARTGERRIGFVATRSELERLDHLPLAGYLIETHRRRLPVIPPLIIGDQSDPALALARWARRHRVSSAVAGSGPTRRLLADARVRTPGASELSQGYRGVAAHAAELLALRLQTIGPGETEEPATLLLPPAQGMGGER